MRKRKPACSIADRKMPASSVVKRARSVSWYTTSSLLASMREKSSSVFTSFKRRNPFR
jgi:hypothetical protein